MTDGYRRWNKIERDLIGLNGLSPYPPNTEAALSAPAEEAPISRL